MAGVAQLRRDVISVAPVDGRLRSSSEEVRAIGRERDRGNRSHDLDFLLDVEVVRANLGNGAISGADEKVAVVQQLQRLDTLREQLLVRAYALEVVLGDRDLYNISSLGADISVAVSGVDHTASKNTLNCLSQDVGVLDLFLNKVQIPSADAVVVHCEALTGSGIEEAYLVGDVLTNRVANQGFAALDLKNKI